MSAGPVFVEAIITQLPDGHVPVSYNDMNNDFESTTIAVADVTTDTGNVTFHSASFGAGLCDLEQLWSVVLSEDESDIVAGLAALEEPVVATWAEVKEQLGL